MYNYVPIESDKFTMAITLSDLPKFICAVLLPIPDCYDYTSEKDRQLSKFALIELSGTRSGFLFPHKRLDVREGLSFYAHNKRIINRTAPVRMTMHNKRIIVAVTTQTRNAINMSPAD
ncbi:hypothetical protein TELCIR_04010 [Teladorsagia circumcincta]|uniref:Uncharacterized protein n=1 Tax=Teladorsagia circumcincta TaxID=45464 RepID=A0A2G9UW88_TELCI|nr:hypothetical protein TELCIR_04010 [Teladorsagia circumcincta]